ncbi:MAG TPA: TIGR02757 family protein, partial [Vicinamibacterales bacterium]
MERRELGDRLERLYDAYNRQDAAADPVQIVRRYSTPGDQEVVGFCAAALAFGRVASVLNTVETLAKTLGPEPDAYVRRFDPGAPHPELRAMVHRWIRGIDVVALLWVLRQMIDQSGSIEGFFLEGYDPAAVDVGAALDSFSRRAMELDLGAAYGRRVPKQKGVRYFFPRPSAGSGCKRMNLFLRWMVRRDEVDLGAWTRIPPSRLIVPLDTHVIRLGRCLGLTRYTSPGWKMAAEVTASLRAIDPDDPVRFDFSLCHVGMMNACGFGRRQGD